MNNLTGKKENFIFSGINGCYGICKALLVDIWFKKSNFTIMF